MHPIYPVLAKEYVAHIPNMVPLFISLPPHYNLGISESLRQKARENVYLESQFGKMECYWSSSTLCVKKRWSTLNPKRHDPPLPPLYLVKNIEMFNLQNRFVWMDGMFTKNSNVKKNSMRVSLKLYDEYHSLFPLFHKKKTKAKIFDSSR